MATKKEQVAIEVAKAVGAGKVVAMETVDFNDPNRPKTCLEVDFPILPVNQVAIIEGNAGKPIYQMSKWWARRRSSVFRSMLIAAATKAPDDKSHAAKLVWDNYYANHQKKGAFKHLKVADIFMGGGTTLVEGSRLGMQMIGNDLNPVAWFVVKQELANVDLDEVKRLLADIEAEVKPQIMPYYYCDGPQGEKGKWTHLPSNQVMSADFDPLSLSQEQRREYRYEGPEIIYTFWAKHGPCQVTGCGHRTPIMSSPVMAVKTISVKCWEQNCSKCGGAFDVEETAARMAPDVPLYVSPNERPYSVLDPRLGVVCPHCDHSAMVKLGKGKSKKIELSLLVHPEWLAGSSKQDAKGQLFGGSVQDDMASTFLWNQERASKIRLLEVRGVERKLVLDKKTGEMKEQEVIPTVVTCPETKATFFTDARGGTSALKDKKIKGSKEVELDEHGPIKSAEDSSFTCQADGHKNDVLTAIKASKKTGPMAAYAIQGYSPSRDESGESYGGRFFAPFDLPLARQMNAVQKEWECRQNTDLADYWPRSELPYGFMTHMNNGGIPNHGFSHWWMMFNPRQLLAHALILKAIDRAGNYSPVIREYVLCAYQQFLNYNNMFCHWHMARDMVAQLFSNNNFHPKSTVLENSVFCNVGSGNWRATTSALFKAGEWKKRPWEIVSKENALKIDPEVGKDISGKSEKVFPGDVVCEVPVFCGSSTEMTHISTSSVDIVITDPPFGDLLHYSELSDFFYVWFRLVLNKTYPELFSQPYTPKSLEAVANRAREPEDPDGFYQRLLTQCWSEAHRALKPSGILAFTFHHSEDKPWIAVLESLFSAGFYLEATYPIRSDDAKGEKAKPGNYGSQTIEFDIIHVCRKRTEEPTPVSWGRMRREVMADVRQLQAMLENHAKEGLPAADIQVIRRGKALEYFSRHYGKVYVDEGRAISVRDALVGINQLIDEDADKGKEPPPVNSEPISRQFLRTFDGKTEIPRDQLQKFLKGSITTPDEFVQRGWCSEKSKMFTVADPLDFARDWQGKHRRKLTSDLDQALVLIGACFDGSGINASDTLKNDNFKPHVALKPLLEWLSLRAANLPSRNAASRAVSIFTSWAATQAPKPKQASLFEDYEL